MLLGESLALLRLTYPPCLILVTDCYLAPLPASILHVYVHMCCMLDVSACVCGVGGGHQCPAQSASMLFL